MTAKGGRCRAGAAAFGLGLWLLGPQALGVAGADSGRRRLGQQDRRPQFRAGRDVDGTERRNGGASPADRDSGRVTPVVARLPSPAEFG